MKTKMIALTLILFSLVLFTGCADTSNVTECLQPTEYTYGFFSGCWHGTITLFSFIGSLFSDNIAIYAVNNTGGWYDFGFVIGLGGFFKIIGGLIQIILGSSRL